MCMCMSPRARWKMVHRSNLYMLSGSVMQAGVTCTSFSNYTACTSYTWFVLHTSSSISNGQSSITSPPVFSLATILSSAAALPSWSFFTASSTSSLVCWGVFVSECSLRSRFYFFLHIQYLLKVFISTLQLLLTLL